MWLKATVKKRSNAPSEYQRFPHNARLHFEWTSCTTYSIKIYKFESRRVKKESKAGQLSKIDLYCTTNNSNKRGNIFVYLFLLSDRNKSLGSCQHFADTISIYKCYSTRALGTQHKVQSYLMLIIKNNGMGNLYDTEWRATHMYTKTKLCCKTASLPCNTFIRNCIYLITYLYMDRNTHNSYGVEQP